MIRALSLRLLAGSLLVLGLAACSVTKQVSAPELLDLGTAPAATSAVTPRAPLLLDELDVSPLLEGPSVIWRDGELGQPQRYAYFRWVAAPGQLIEQRLREVLSRNGPMLTRVTTAQSLQLHVSVDRFEQVFINGRSHAQLSLRALLTRSGQVIDQLHVDERIAAPSDDAPGGANALRQATDRAVIRMNDWLASRPETKPAAPGSTSTSPSTFGTPRR
ncbi:hypothetical protein FXN63_24230 [Pigmentiphaga aceris]|uniref:ABC-type transport auxiliary lipoprotein component domain-containing protein n=1 Tax=Pigmentiphaga aceris TaxID=1940612 RepID=A0A5C0B6M7_9BURK|nr:ABC-type transport auxiliary lipoprotein family protein [Pigmentiphaga aceris]QEI08601.1 hypothetical protein FXN63_24230 [Pigmentiphaga aceris]